MPFGPPSHSSDSPEHAPRAVDDPLSDLVLGGEEFDDITALAAQLADTPMAWLLAFGTDDRLRVVARHGVDANGDAGIAGMCDAIDAQLPRLTVPDARADACFEGNALVSGYPGLGFLHGQALFGQGGRHLGALAVADARPRAACGRETMRAIERLAGLAERLLERQHLQRRNRIATQIMQATFSAMVVTDEHGQVTLVNRAGEVLFGMRARRMRGMPVDVLFPTYLQPDPVGASGWMHGLDLDTAPPREARYQLRSLGPGGDVRTLEATRCSWKLGRGHGQAIILRDITEDLEQQATLRQIALYDALTGLPNRTAVVEMLSARLEVDESPLGLALIGLDNFKTINDTLGHSAGDAVLQATAHRIRATLPAGATLGRFGGDEFAMLFTGATDDEVPAWLALVLEAVAEPLDVGGNPIHMEASIGFAMREDARSDDRLPSSSELIARADLALYKAKARGGRQWCRYDTGMRREVIERRLLEIELRRAHARGEFELHYQPQIDLATGMTFGAEALLRWRHPERGLLAPAAFLDTLANSALANDVGRWIIRQACRDAASWPTVDGREIAISINLFPGQVHESDLGKDVDDALSSSGLSAERLELEITETIALKPDDSASRALACLRGRGVKLSFDDFGTGFASLSMLQRFPIDRVKIDRSFVRDMLANTGDAAIVRSIVLISRNMALHVTAEGVETHAQANLLRGLGCQAAQGFLYAPALETSAFEKWLATQTVDPAQAPWLQREPENG